ncbi:MAG: hypothetical protein IKZ96_01500 [Bacilli bacterium]|nr:hypothetical protein [Bacilli bacterium]
MKKALIIIGIAIVLIIVMIVLCIVLSNRKTKISEIKHFSFSYSQGYAVNSNIIYTLDYENNIYTATVKPYGIPEEEKRTIFVSTETVKGIEKVLDKYDVGSWDGFKKSDKYVLDGDSFGLYVTFKNGESISANGYMSWPKNYSNVRNELDNIFMNLYNSVY